MVTFEAMGNLCPERNDQSRVSNHRVPIPPRRQRHGARPSSVSRLLLLLAVIAGSVWVAADSTNNYDVPTLTVPETVEQGEPLEIEGTSSHYPLTVEVTDSNGHTEHGEIGNAGANPISVEHTGMAGTSLTVKITNALGRSTTKSVLVV